MFATMRPGGVVTTESEPCNSVGDVGTSSTVIAASPDLFDTVGLRIRRGRDLP